MMIVVVVKKNGSKSKNILCFARNQLVDRMFQVIASAQKSSLRPSFIPLSRATVLSQHPLRYPLVLGHMGRGTLVSDAQLSEE